MSEVGRPPKYKTPEEMQAVIDEYFQRCDAEEEPYTITGLALALDLSRTSLIDYANNKSDGFSYTVKRAKLKVESFLERRLFENAPTGAIFNLKNNFGWKDAQNVEHGGKVEIGWMPSE